MTIKSESLQANGAFRISADEFQSKLNKCGNNTQCKNQILQLTEKESNRNIKIVNKLYQKGKLTNNQVDTFYDLSQKMMYGAGKS